MPLSFQGSVFFGPPGAPESLRNRSPWSLSAGVWARVQGQGTQSKTLNPRSNNVLKHPAPSLAAYTTLSWSSSATSAEGSDASGWPPSFQSCAESICLLGWSGISGYTFPVYPQRLTPPNQILLKTDMLYLYMFTVHVFSFQSQRPARNSLLSSQSCPC